MNYTEFVRGIEKTNLGWAVAFYKKFKNEHPDIFPLLLDTRLAIEEMAEENIDAITALLNSREKYFCGSTYGDIATIQYGELELIRKQRDLNDKEQALYERLRDNGLAIVIGTDYGEACNKKDRKKVDEIMKFLRNEGLERLRPFVEGMKDVARLSEEIRRKV